MVFLNGALRGSNVAALHCLIAACRSTEAAVARLVKTASSNKGSVAAVARAASTSSNEPRHSATTFR